MLPKPKFLTGEVKEFITFYFSWYKSGSNISDDDMFDVCQFLSQPFQPEMITEYYKGWRKGASFWQHDVFTDYLFQMERSANGFTLNDKTQLSNLKIKTLSQFITNCIQAGIKLEWMSEKEEFEELESPVGLQSGLIPGQSIKEITNIPKQFTTEFINFLLVNALRCLTEEQRHELTVALMERDQKVIDEKETLLKLTAELGSAAIGMIFSKRKELEERVNSYLLENNIPKTTFNIITALHSIGKLKENN